MLWTSVIALILCVASVWFYSASRNIRLPQVTSNNSALPGQKENANDARLRGPVQNAINQAALKAFDRRGKLAGQVTEKDMHRLVDVASESFIFYTGKPDAETVVKFFSKQGWTPFKTWESDPDVAMKRWQEWSETVVGTPDWNKAEVSRVIEDGNSIPQAPSLTQSVQSYNPAVGSVVMNGGLEGRDVYEIRVPTKFLMNGSAFEAMFGMQVIKDNEGDGWKLLGVAIRDIPNDVRFTTPPLN